jgi:hypothetical protein
MMRDKSASMLKSIYDEEGGKFLGSVCELMERNPRGSNTFQEKRKIVERVIEEIRYLKTG